jgi:hypothetical protein
MARSFFKDESMLRRARLAPRHKLADDESKSWAATWNHIGGLIERLSHSCGIDAAAVLALWQVEAGGFAFRRGRPLLRFEAHKFFESWGRNNPQAFDRHFQFGGRGEIPGRPWERQRFRPAPTGEWRPFHGSQDAEYEVFALARKLSSPEAACLASSFGGPQIMGFNHALVGYPTAAALRQAFAGSPRWQVIAFFDFCASKELMGAIQLADWQHFAAVYNGPGQAEAYAARLAAAHAQAARFIASLPAQQPSRQP